MLITGALVLPASLVIGTGVASAKSTVQPGSVTCSVTGFVKFSPALTSAGGATTETVSSEDKLSNCTTTGGGAVPKKGESKSSAKTTTNSCSAVLDAPATAESFTYKWAPKSIAPTSLDFPPDTSSVNSSGDITLTYGGAGTSGTGSYASGNGAGSNATVTFSQSESALEAACSTKKGVKELTIASGTFTAK
ncbi:MAG: hypothetical protein ACRDY1_01525 [Acidimicrobiales bacterium]